MEIMKRFTSVFFLGAILVSVTGAQTGTPPLKAAALGDSSQIYVQEIINSKIPVFIEFWAVWCGPCKMLTPIIDEIKSEYKGKIRVLKINVDRNQSLATYFRVVSIPNVFIVKDKIVVNTILGVQPKEVYINAIKAALGPATPNPENSK
jgi:thioredoxin 1